MSVAMAAPATPISKTMIKSKSRTTFITEAYARYISDLFELPEAFKMPATML